MYVVDGLVEICERVQHILCGTTTSMHWQFLFLKTIFFLYERMWVDKLTGDARLPHICKRIIRIASWNDYINVCMGGIRKCTYVKEIALENSARFMYTSDQGDNWIFLTERETQHCNTYNNSSILFPFYGRVMFAFAPKGEQVVNILIGSFIFRVR